MQYSVGILYSEVIVSGLAQHGTGLLSVPWSIGESGHRRLPRAVRGSVTLLNWVGSCEALAQQHGLGRANNPSNIVATLELRKDRGRWSRGQGVWNPFIHCLTM